MAFLKGEQYSLSNVSPGPHTLRGGTSDTWCGSFFSVGYGQCWQCGLDGRQPRPHRHDKRRYHRGEYLYREYSTPFNKCEGWEPGVLPAALPLLHRPCLHLVISCQPEHRHTSTGSPNEDWRPVSHGLHT